MTEQEYTYDPDTQVIVIDSDNGGENASMFFPLFATGFIWWNGYWVNREGYYYSNNDAGCTWMIAIGMGIGMVIGTTTGIITGIIIGTTVAEMLIFAIGIRSIGKATLFKEDMELAGAVLITAAGLGSTAEVAEAAADIGKN